EAHAATPDPESAPPPSRSARAVPDGFASLLGDDAAELIEADPVEESRAFQRLQGWAPQKTVRTPVDPANAPWEAEDGEAPPPWSRSTDDGEAPPPPWGTELGQEGDA